MFVAGLIAAGIVWNVVDGVAGMFLVEGLIPIFSIFCLGIVADMIFTITVATNAGAGKHVLAIWELQLPVLVSGLAVLWVVALRNDIRWFFPMAILSGVSAGAFWIYTSITQWLYGSNAYASDGAQGVTPVFLKEIGVPYPDPEKNEYWRASLSHGISSSYHAITYGQTAILGSVTSALIGIFCALFIYWRFDLD